MEPPYKFQTMISIFMQYLHLLNNSNANNSARHLGESSIVGSVFYLHVILLKRDASYIKM